MTFQAWVCESCRNPHRTRSRIWNCPGCDKECCELCFRIFAHCRSCAMGKSEEELRLAANAKGWDFT